MLVKAKELVRHIVCFLLVKGSEVYEQSMYRSYDREKARLEKLEILTADDGEDQQ